MNINLFVITSPLQYLNALEARHSYRIVDANAVLFIVPNRQGDESLRQVERILSASSWRRIVVAEGLPPRRLVKRPKLVKNLQYYWGGLTFRKQVAELLADIGEVERIFLGDWRARSFRHFLAMCPQAEVTLLDDGSVTNQTFRFRNDPRDPLVERGAFPTRLGRALSLAGLRFHDPKHLTFFTSYILPTGRRDSVRQHSFEVLKATEESWIRSDEVWFIGSNHAENGISTDEAYLALLGRIRTFFQGETIRYFAHRGEHREKLEKLERSGFVVTHSELPLEVVIRDGKRYPKVLGAIASSVVDNLAAILGARLTVFLFLAPRSYYRKRLFHLADIIRYHLQAAGGNFFAVDLRGSDIIDPENPSASYSSYAPLIQNYISISAFGAYSSQPEATSIKAILSGATYAPTRLRNTAFDVFLEEKELSLDVPLETTWPSLRTTPTLRSAKRPIANGRRHWLLVEGPTQNLLLGDVPSATNIGCDARSVTIANGVVAPSGPVGAFQISEDGSFGLHALAFNSAPLVEGEAYCLSCYVKRAGRDHVELRAEGTGDDRSALFDLSAKACLTPHVQNATLVTDQEHWCRISLSFRASSTNPKLALQLMPGPSADLSGTYLGDQLSGVYIFGPQLSLGETPPTYLAPSQGSARARPGDVVRVRTLSSPFDGPMVVLMHFHVPFWPSAPLPLLRVTGPLADSIDLRIGPNQLQISIGSAPPLVQAVSLSEQTIRLVIQVQDDASRVDVAVNGIHIPFDLPERLRWVGPKEWALGFAEDEPFQLLVEEWRLGGGATSPDDLGPLSRLYELEMPHQRRLSARSG